MKWPARVARESPCSCNRKVFDILHSSLIQLVLLFVLLEKVFVTSGQRTLARQGSGGRESVVIRIPGQGSITGKEVFLGRNQKVTQYLGIPYAQAPLGKLRFAPPVTDPLPTWDGTKNASQYAPSCQQVSDRLKRHEKLYMRLLPPDQPDPGVSEDCLFLNIFVPDGNRPSEGWPVMVWFHGGDFNTGTPAIWDASVFVTKQKVLMVTVAYRLNILGFFTTTDAEAPGNYGMFDQIAALDWVQKNIELFDGAPSNVVIYGHSSGAISVGLHLISPLSKGKFAKAIAMSGDAIGSVGSPEKELSVVDAVADRFGCYRRPTTALMECLRRVDAGVLVKQSSDIETWGPIFDLETNNESMPFLPEEPKDVVESGSVNSVPLIVGYTNNEQALAYMDVVGEASDGRLSRKRFESMIVDEFESVVGFDDGNGTCELKPYMVSAAVLFFYTPRPPTKDQGLLRDKYLLMQTERNFAAGLTLLAGKVSKKESAFVYRFDYRPKTVSITRDVPEWAGVPHMFDLPFAWGLPHAQGSPIQWNNADKKMSDVIMTMLATFARTGNPSLPSVTWAPYTEDKPGILIIDRNIDMSEPNAIDYRALAFWNDYYPMIVKEAKDNCCNMTSSSTSLDLNRNVCVGSVVAMMTLQWLRI